MQTLYCLRIKRDTHDLFRCIVRGRASTAEGGSLRSVYVTPRGCTNRCGRCWNQVSLCWRKGRVLAVQPHPLLFFCSALLEECKFAPDRTDTFTRIYTVSMTTFINACDPSPSPPPHTQTQENKAHLRALLARLFLKLTSWPGKSCMAL